MEQAVENEARLVSTISVLFKRVDGCIASDGASGCQTNNIDSVAQHSEHLVVSLYIVKDSKKEGK